VKRDSLRGAHDALRKQRLDEFMAGFSVIPLTLKPWWPVKVWERNPQPYSAI